MEIVKFTHTSKSVTCLYLTPDPKQSYSLCENDSATIYINLACLLTVTERALKPSHKLTGKIIKAAQPLASH